MNRPPCPRPERRRCLTTLAALLAAPAVATAPPTALERVRQRGALVVGLYQDMPPFHVNGQGIDVDLARAVAERLGVGLSMLPFHADENMDDDLRNVVWRGHFLGWGPADVLLHVPVDPPLMRANPQVQIFAPYYRDRVALACRRDRVASIATLADLRGLAIAVAGQSLAGWLLIGAEDGALRESLSTRWSDGAAAARALQAGDVQAAAGLASELESVLSQDADYAIVPLPSPRAPRDGWAVGCAVKKDAQDLALALQQAVDELTRSGQTSTLFRHHGVSWRL